MAKIASFFILALLLSLLSPSFAVRPEPKTQKHQGIEAKQAEIEENCGGVGAEECLMGKTAAAHLDYIYTQNHKP